MTSHRISIYLLDNFRSNLASPLFELAGLLQLSHAKAKKFYYVSNTCEQLSPPSSRLTEIKYDYRSTGQVISGNANASQMTEMVVC
jgi:hypothetical protein